MKNEEIIELIQEALPDRKVCTILLSGSRLNRIDNKNSDYDLYVIVADKKEELLTKNRYSKQKVIFDNKNTTFDLKIMSQTKFLNTILKMNFNTFELLYQKPIYNISEDTVFSYLKNNRSLLFQKGFYSEMIPSVRGYARREQKQLMNGRVNSKNIIQIMKGTWYIYQLLNDNVENMCVNCSQNKIGYFKKHLEDVDNLKKELTSCVDFLNRIVETSNEVEKEVVNCKNLLLRKSFDSIIKYTK